MEDGDIEPDEVELDQENDNFCRLKKVFNHFSKNLYPDRCVYPISNSRSRI